MMHLILYILKIIFSLLCSCLIVYIFVDDDFKNKNYQFHSKMALFGSSMLSLMYSISSNIDNYNLLTLSIFLFAFITFHFIRKSSDDSKMLYILTFCCILVISLGYILYSFILICLYYFLLNNHIFISSEENFDVIDDSEDKDE